MALIQASDIALARSQSIEAMKTLIEGKVATTVAGGNVTIWTGTKPATSYKAGMTNTQVQRALMFCPDFSFIMDAANDHLIRTKSEELDDGAALSTGSDEKADILAKIMKSMSISSKVAQILECKVPEIRTTLEACKDDKKLKKIKDLCASMVEKLNATV